jgi:hypothetical protein
VITVVDTSASMDGCFPEIMEFLKNEVLQAHVKQGDIFHLIQFSTRSRHELTMKIEDSQSFREIGKKLAFLKQKVFFGMYTDIVMALNELSAYISQLPVSRQKKIFFFTDGINDPPEQSPYADKDPDIVRSDILSCTRIVQEKSGWFVLSLDVLPGFNLPDAQEILSRKQDSSSSDPLKANIEIAQFLQLIARLESDESNYKAGTDRRNRSSGKDARISGFFRFLQISRYAAGIFISIILLLAIIILVRKKKLESSFKNIFNPKKWQENLSILFGSGDSLVEMRVSFQNRHIGFRNIHRMKENKNLSIGGGLSNFLIFLIPMPQHIAEITKENGTYVFTPIQKEFFPGVRNPIADCLNREIPVISKHGYCSMITFTPYVSPLARLHTLLHSIKYENGNTKEILHTHKLALAQTTAGNGRVKNVP